MTNVIWTEDSLDELLDKSIGDIREMLAHEDADVDFRTFLLENGWIEDINEDYDDEEDWDEEDTPSDLTSEEEELALNISRDIRCGNYSFNTIGGLYNENILNRVRELI